MDDSEDSLESSYFQHINAQKERNTVPRNMAEHQRSMTPRMSTPQSVFEHNYGQACPHCPAPSAAQCYHDSMLHRNMSNMSPMPFGLQSGPVCNVMFGNTNSINDMNGNQRMISPTDQLGNGHTPDKETVIEITKIANHGDGYFSRENLRKTQEQRLNLNDTFSRLSSQPFSRLSHPRKSPPLKRYYRTPSPPSMQSHVPQLTREPMRMNNNGCYFGGNVRPRPSSAKGSSKCSDPVHSLANASNTTTMLQSAASHSISAPRSSSNPKNSITVKSNGVTRTIAILNCNRTSSATSTLSSSTTSEVPVKKEKGEGKLNTSLTNIQWLGEMKALEGGNAQSAQGGTRSTHKDLRVIASDKQIAQISAECGRNKRPPYSYMHLIQMAICSKEDRHLTLREIYKWIEDKFPYYKYHPNQGWKNSIRHNLSLYDIFVRKKVAVPGKSGTSYWTLSEDASKAIVKTPSEGEESTPSPPPDVPAPIMVISDGNKSSSKKQPVPLLPKSDPSQAYALIPLQGGVPIMSSQPIIVPANWALSRSGQVHDQSGDLDKSGHKRNLSPVGGPRKNEVKIAPKMDLSSFSVNLNELSQLSWLSSSYMGNTLDTTDLQSQLQYFKFVDSGIEGCDIKASDIKLEHNGDSRSSELEYHGLPKPQVYESHYKRITPRNSKRKLKLPSPSPSKKRTSSSSSAEKDSAMYSLNEDHFSDASIGDILTGIEKGLPSPVALLLRTPTKEKANITSTPYKGDLSSPSWLSPIRGLSPNSNDAMERAPFTPPPEGKKASTPLEGNLLNTPNGNLCTPSKGMLNTPFASYSFGASPTFKLDKSPQTGFMRAFGLAGLSPLKVVSNTGEVSPSVYKNESFNSVFADFQIDNVLDEADGSGGQMDLSDFSFSVFN